MQIEPSYITTAVGLGLGAIAWLFKVHYDLIQLRRDGRDVEKQRVNMVSHYDAEMARIRSEVGSVRAEAQNGHSSLKDSMAKLELRIEVGFTQLIEQMKTLFENNRKQQ